MLSSLRCTEIMLGGLRAYDSVGAGQPILGTGASISLQSIVLFRLGYSSFEILNMLRYNPVNF